MNYPNRKSNDLNIRTGYSFLQYLNNDKLNDTLLVLNTKKDENGKTVYIIRNKNRTIIFNHTTRVDIPWFTIKEKEKSFTYNSKNFNIFYNMFIEKESMIKKLIIDFEQDIELTKSLFKKFCYCNYKETVRLKDLEHLSIYLNRETKLALSLTLDEETAKKWLELMILEGHTICNYGQEIKELFEKKLTPILMKKNAERNIVKSRITRKNIQDNQTLFEMYNHIMSDRIEVLTPVVEKANLYIQLNKELINTTVLRKNKI
jgi:hypothetical protein